MLSRYEAATVPSSACDGERYGWSAVPSRVSWRWFEPSGEATQTLASLTKTIESAEAVAAGIEQDRHHGQQKSQRHGEHPSGAPVVPHRGFA